MRFDKWVKTYLGKRTDWDGMYGVQCVDLADCFIAECLELQIGFFGNAKFWWINREKSAWLKKHFDFITPNYKNGELLRGDIGVRATGTYGHIFIIAETNTDGRVRYYDQNATGNGDIMILRDREYSPNTITGILRPKDRKNLIATPPKVKLGDYKLTNARGVYKGYGAKSGRKTVGELTDDGRKHATSRRKAAEAFLKADTPVTLSEVKLLNTGNLWARIPSGYICIWEADIDKLFIK